MSDIDVDARIDEVSRAGVAASSAGLVFADALGRLAHDVDHATTLTNEQREACAFAPQMIDKFVDSLRNDLKWHADIIAAMVKTP